MSDAASESVILLRMRMLILPILLLVMVATGGCQQTLFPSNAPRHQFQTHDTMRGRNVPLTEPDVFGNPQPALRSRLSRTR